MKKKNSRTKLSELSLLNFDIYFKWIKTRTLTILLETYL